MKDRRKNSVSQVKVIRSALDALQCLLREPSSLGVTQVATRLALPKSTTFRLLNALVELGLADKNAVSNRYSLNPSVFGFIHELASHFGPLGRFTEVLREEALRLDCSLYISALSGGNTYVVAASGSLGDSFALGLHAAVHTSSAGKVLVAGLPRPEWAVYAPTPATPKLTKFTNVEPSRFLIELEAAQGSGVAWSHEETSLGYVSVAAPVREKLRAPRLAVAILLPKRALTFRDLTVLENEIKRVAARLEGC